MADGRVNNGGKRKGQGRPKKAVEQHALSIIKSALRALYSTDDNDEAKIAFLKDFAVTQRGQQFIAEHLFGKPKDIVENINRNFAVRELTAKEIKALNNELENEY